MNPETLEETINLALCFGFRFIVDLLYNLSLDLLHLNSWSFSCFHLDLFYFIDFFFFWRHIFHKFYNLWFFKKNLIDKQFYWFYLLRFKRRVLQSYVYITFVYIYIKSDSMYLAMKQSHGLIFFIGILKNLRASVSCKYGLPIH